MFDAENFLEMLYSIAVSLVVGMAKVFSKVKFSSKKPKPKIGIGWVVGQLFVSGAAGVLNVFHGFVFWKF